MKGKISTDVEKTKEQTGIGDLNESEKLQRDSIPNLAISVPLKAPTMPSSSSREA